MLDKEIFKDHSDYWLVAENIRDIYLSEGSLLTLLDFERVLDELDLYAFKHWQLGELVEGPDIGKYTVGCIFMWPERLMPDPRGARRLLPFDCKIRYKKTRIKIPIKIEEPDDFRPGTHKARIVEKPIWLVEIVMPKALMSDIRTGSIELEDQDIDLEDLDSAYEEDLTNKNSNKMINNKIHSNSPRSLLETLEHKDMEGMLKPTLHVDEFASKMGDDDDIIVVSFFVRSRQAADDLANWFEKGYDWVLDADTSPGEIRPGRYLVYIELRRRSTAGSHLARALDDLGTLTEFESASDWTMHYEDQSLPFDRETFDRLVPLSPQGYRERKEKDLNEMRTAAGISVKPVFEVGQDLRQLQSAAGI